MSENRKSSEVPKAAAAVIASIKPRPPAELPRPNRSVLLAEGDPPTAKVMTEILEQKPVDIGELQHLLIRCPGDVPFEAGGESPVLLTPANGIQLAGFVSMAKQSNTNTAFFKMGGRGAVAHEPTSHGEEKPLRNHPHGAKMEGKEGQPNFIPGEAPVGQMGRSRPAKKKRHL